MSLMRRATFGSKWMMIGLAFLATTIIYMERQALSVVVPVLMERFPMGSIAYSHVIFAFMLAYTVMNGLAGPLIDRLGTRAGFALITLWWSGAAMLQALARGAWSLGACRFLLGMGEAGNWPACVKVVAEWFPVHQRALASGIFNSGAAFGAIVTPPIAVWIVLKAGWRAAFLTVGLTALAWVALWLLIYRTPREVQAEISARPISPWTLVHDRFVWSFTGAKIFLDPVWYFYVFWFPEYLKRARHLELASIGRIAWIPYLVAGFGNIAGGWFSGYLMRRGVPLNTARKSAVTVFIALMASAIPAVLVPDTGLAIALISMAMVGYTGVSANMLAFPADVYPKNLVASVWGFAGVGSGFGGMFFVLVTGWLVDHYSFTPVFIGFGVIPLVALAIIWLVMGPLCPAPAMPVEAAAFEP
jgi:MFS transporter, ACS family, hexuronate transporter